MTDILWGTGKEISLSQRSTSKSSAKKEKGESQDAANDNISAFPVASVRML